MEQKVSLIGVRNIVGVSAKNSRPYSFWMATAIEPLQVGGAIAFAAGFEPREYEVSDQAAAVLKNQAYPLECVVHLVLNRENKVRINTVTIPNRAAPVRPATTSAQA